MSRLVHVACLAASIAVQAPLAHANEGFPGGRLITLVVPFPPGGGVDTVARGLAERLARELGVPVIVDNRPGGSSVLATNYVSKATPDGHTLLIGTPALSINAALLPNRPPGDPRKVLLPVVRLANLPYVLTVAPSMPVKDLPELVAWAKENPQQMMLGNSGPLTAPRMAAELFGHMTGIKVTSVPFRGGGPQEVEITSGRIAGAFAQISEALRMLASGAKPIAVSSEKRSPLLPDVPSVSEYLPGFDVTSWNGIYVPVGTPAAVVARLNQAINVVLQDQNMRDHYGKLGYELVGGTPADLGRYLDSEIEKWTALQNALRLPIN